MAKPALVIKLIRIDIRLKSTNDQENRYLDYISNILSQKIFNFIKMELQNHDLEIFPPHFDDFTYKPLLFKADFDIIKG